MIRENGRRIFQILAAVFILVASAEAEEQPRDFTLALSWQPAFCEINRDRMECRREQPEQWGARHFVLHGLWPNVDRNRDGRIDSDDNYCLDESERTVVQRTNWRNLPPVHLPDNLRRDLDRVMPGAMSLLDRHQWIKHGTCSGLDQTRYFAAAIGRTDDFADSRLSAFVAAHIDQRVTRREVLAAFEDDFGAGSSKTLRLYCRRTNGVATLSEIRLMLRGDRLERELSRASLLIPDRAVAGTCPTQFRIDQAG